MRKLQAKSVLITGASRRIGRAIALGMAEAGFNVAVHYNTSADDAAEVCREIEALGVAATPVFADLTNDKDIRSLIPNVTDALGPLGILVNNASLFEEDDLQAANAELWDNHFQVHVKAPSILSHDFAEQVEREKSGLIVNIIDQRIWKLNPNFHSYTMSKSALWAATRTMAQALAPKVRVNAIGPGPTLPSHRQTQEIFDKQVRTLPLEIAPQLDEFARTIRYFAESPSVTGQMIALDSGQHLAWQTDDLKVPE